MYELLSRVYALCVATASLHQSKGFGWFGGFPRCTAGQTKRRLLPPSPPTNQRPKKNLHATKEQYIFSLLFVNVVDQESLDFSSISHHHHHHHRHTLSPHTLTIYYHSSLSSLLFPNTSLSFISNPKVWSRPSSTK